jgi:predicted Zn-dependent protease
MVDDIKRKMKNDKNSLIDWRNIFDHSCELLFSKLRGSEILTCAFSAEQSDFVRFNNGKVRQASHVLQAEIQFELVLHNKKSSTSLMLSDDRAINLSRLESAFEDLQLLVPTLPDDPFIAPVVNNGESTVLNSGHFPEVAELLLDIASLTEGIDLAGLWASGHCYRGNRNSLGQAHWFASTSFFFDYSLYTAKERAVKGSYSGTEYIKEKLKESLALSCQSLAVMEFEKTELKPGQYRCYLAPSAVAELLHTWSWGGLSAGALKRGESFMADYVEGSKTFSPLFSLNEEYSLGLSPRFNESGEVSPMRISLIDRGELKELLVSTQTEKEFGTPSNYAGSAEQPRSPEIQGGDLALADVLKKLGTGVYISNLHYLNWSDRHSGRITGMTRFGCLWVEEGEIQGPIQDMRFDERLSHIFGRGLEAITSFSETHVEVDTYGQRAIGGNKVPGMVINDLTFTL